MKRFITLTFSLAVALWISGLTFAVAQGHRNGGSHGQKPAQTGLEHGEAKANPKGVQHGIENAEAKQTAHKHKKFAKAKGKHKTKHSSVAAH
ncbi:MAG: hypothetical protein DMG86_13580 [Acidobacteria bacterium]|jgi:hypothetical protein|nr:MAG: hypothetical protein DMG86_13580 [Acidobacteriota bacterium]PYX10923.1 MAG: hypothetical protein DMG85_07240 [Acidobacteriota bacterium]PYX11225.1 MAG: hypothetical protein DMG84_24345 [Acidobacteriota bacterium]